MYKFEEDYQFTIDTFVDIQKEIDEGFKNKTVSAEAEPGLQARNAMNVQVKLLAMIGSDMRKVIELLSELKKT